MAYTRQELEELVNRHAPAVYRLAYARTGSREDAEDVMQEVFLRLLRRAPELNGEDHLRAWLLHAAANCANSLHRRPWRRRELPLEEGAVQAAPPEHNEALEAVLALPEKYRVPVCLHYCEGYTTAEVADILGKKEATVRTWLFRARGLLRDMLTEEGTYEF